MSEQMVRGYWANGALSFIDNHYSASTSERLIGGLPRELRESVAQLGPAEWCPQSQHVELLNVIASVHDEEARAFEDLMEYGHYVGSEVIAIINEECFFELDAAPVRVHSKLVPQPYNHTLEKATIPDHEDVVKAVLKMFGRA